MSYIFVCSNGHRSHSASKTQKDPTCPECGEPTERVDENDVRETLRPADKVDWYQNCLTEGIHGGREGALWSMPLGYAVQIFQAQTLRELVIARIYSDAMQLVEHGEGFTQEWAEAVKQKAEEMYSRTLQRKVEEFRNYYLTPGWESDQERAVRLVQEDKLNILYEPLHGHDTINMLCRIIGVSSSR